MQALIQQLLRSQNRIRDAEPGVASSQAVLDESRARNFRTLRHPPVGLCTINEHGLIVESNRTHSNLLG